LSNEYKLMSRHFHGIRTYVETAANRTPEQLLGIIRRKAENALLPRLPFDIDAYYDRRVPDNLDCHCAPFATNTSRLRAALEPEERTRYRDVARESADGTVTFLSSTHRFDNTSEIYWHDGPLETESLLWWLKLEGFEHFAWPVLGYETHDDAPDDVHTGYEQWFRSWVREHAIADEPGFLRQDWIPHSVSLRILNWSRYLAWAGETLEKETKRTMTYQVAKNAAFLSDHVEYDLDGNHLVENAVALVAAGVLTGTDRWCAQGLSVFERAARTQFLNDGGHFERSPMYHIQVLTRFLTAIDLLELTERDVPACVRTAASDGLSYLARLRPPDNRIPLLHDSVYGEVLSLPSCLAYGDRVGIDGADAERADALPDSGYYWLGDGGDAMLCAGGPLAVPSLPAHAHIHLGHISFYLEEAPILTDTGTYTYESGDRRSTARSISTHNTVQVNETEPIAIAGSFLMGDPVVPRATIINEDVTALATAYKTDFESTYRHRRDLFHSDDWWLVWDRIKTDDSTPVCARYHCHPAVTTRTVNEPGVSYNGAENVGVQLLHEGGAQCDLVPLDADDIDVGMGEYYPQFGVVQERSIVRYLSLEGKSHSFGCFVRTGQDSVNVTTTDGRPTEVGVGDQEYDLPCPRIQGWFK
jgi:hypothetical protein